MIPLADYLIIIGLNRFLYSVIQTHMLDWPQDVCLSVSVSLSVTALLKAKSTYSVILIHAVTGPFSRFFSIKSEVTSPIGKILSNTCSAAPNQSKTTPHLPMSVNCDFRSHFGRKTRANLRAVPRNTESQDADTRKAKHGAKHGAKHDAKREAKHEAKLLQALIHARQNKTQYTSFCDLGSIPSWSLFFKFDTRIFLYFFIQNI